MRTAESLKKLCRTAKCRRHGREILKDGQTPGEHKKRFRTAKNAIAQAVFFFFFSFGNLGKLSNAKIFGRIRGSLKTGIFPAGIRQKLKDCYIPEECRQIRNRRQIAGNRINMQKSCISCRSGNRRIMDIMRSKPGSTSTV